MSDSVFDKLEWLLFTLIFFSSYQTKPSYENRPPQQAALLPISNSSDIVFKKVECILLSGKDERVTKADAAVICEFHEGWLVDMDEGRGQHFKLQRLK